MKKKVTQKTGIDNSNNKTKQKDKKRITSRKDT